MKKKWKIYQIKNKLNGKKYIGMTSNPLRVRVVHHLYFVRHNKGKLLHDAIRKYGWDNFEYEILFDNIDSIEQANQIEWLMVNSSNSNNNGYNYHKGGGSHLSKRNGYKHSQATKDIISLKQMGAENPRAREVCAVNIDTKEIEFRFGSVCEAARAFECNHTTISKAARELKESGERRVAIGKYWIYTDDKSSWDDLYSKEIH